MTLTTIPAELNDKKYRRFCAKWTEGGMQFHVESSIFSDDQSTLAKVYILEHFAREILHVAERNPGPG